MRKSVLVVLIGLLLLGSGPAHAHRMKVFAGGVGNEIEGYGYFAGGGTPQNADVFLQDVDGKVLQTGRSDAEGAFKFTVTVRQDYVIRLDTGDGHVAEFKVLADELSDNLPGPSGEPAAPEPTATDPVSAPAIDEAQLSALVERAVSKQVGPLRRQLDEYEAKVRLHDILGGIGWIIGLFGLAAWWLSRKKTA